jgi:hypothetical protein
MTEGNNPRNWHFLTRHIKMFKNKCYKNSIFINLSYLKTIKTKYYEKN